MSTITEIVKDVYKVAIYDPRRNMQFNHFVIKDDQPLLYHTGSLPMFSTLLEAVSQVITPDQIRWIGFSHYEADECGSINQWLEVAPSAQALGTLTMMGVNRSAILSARARALRKDEVLSTGRFRYRMIPTPHLPHGWDAGMLFEETNRVLFCSDLFHHMGDVPPVTQESLVEPARQALLATQQGSLIDYIPYTSKTSAYIRQLADLEPRILATQHGSTFIGDGASALLELDQVIKDIYEN